MRTGRCKSCGQAIGWVVTQHGKRMPVDINPVGSQSGFRVGEGDMPLATFVPKSPGGEQLYQSHFATCPNAPKHRRPR